MLRATRKRSRSRGTRGSSYRSRVVATRAPYTGTRSKRKIRVTGKHVFSRGTAAETLSVNGTFLAKNFSHNFADLIEYTEFGALFETYRIEKVKITFQLITNPDAIQNLNPGQQSVNGGLIQAANWFPKLWYCVDKDGGTTETLNTMRERQGVRCKVLRPNAMFSISYRPMCRVRTYQVTGGTESSGYSPKSVKIDMADVNVPHYGLNTIVDTMDEDPLNACPFKIRVDTRITFSCYGVR